MRRRPSAAQDTRLRQQERAGADADDSIRACGEPRDGLDFRRIAQHVHAPADDDQSVRRRVAGRRGVERHAPVRRRGTAPSREQEDFIETPPRHLPGRLEGVERTRHVQQPVAGMQIDADAMRHVAL